MPIPTRLHKWAKDLAPPGSGQRRAMEIGIGTTLNLYDYASHTRRARRANSLSVFIAPGGHHVSGGFISIQNLASVSLEVGRAIGIDVEMAWVEGCGRPMRRHPRYRTSWRLRPFHHIVKEFEQFERIWIHVPEFFAAGFAPALAAISPSTLGRVTLNIMNQNIDLMAKPEQLAPLRSLVGNRLTVTTAHKRYATADEGLRLGVSLHHFSTAGDMRRYAFARDLPKRHRMLLSPDDPALNARLSRSLEARVPSLETEVISGVPYDDYLKLALTSQWATTFGEGMDGYFFESAASGGIPFAVYNDRFFLPEFRQLPNVFDSAEELIEAVPSLVTEWGADQATVTEIGEATRRLIGLEVNLESHYRAVLRYYLDELDFPMFDQA